MDSTLERLIKQIDERREGLVESVADGAPKTFEEYKLAVGTIRGLLTAKGIIIDLANRMEHDDDDE